MRFKGTNKEFGIWLQALISTYGPDATIADIQKSVETIRK